MRTGLFFLLLLICVSCAEESVTTTQPIRPVKYHTVESASSRSIVTFTGVTRAGKEANLAFKVAGNIASVPVQDGQRVRKGQLIAVIDPEDYALQVEQAKVQVKQAETSLNVARSTYQRVERLYENNSVSLSEFEQAKGNFEASEAQLETARKQVQSVENQVNYTRLTAPFAGVISNLNIESGEIVSTGTPIATLSTEGEPEVEIGVADSYVGRFKTGQKVEIELSIQPGQSMEGKIDEISYSLSGATTYPVRAKFVKPQTVIRPGLSAEVRIPLEAETDEDYMVVPAKSVGEDAQGKRFVYRLDGSGDTVTVSQQFVDLGELLPTGFVIKDGLNSGDKIASAGLTSLLEGMKVRLLTE